LSGTNPEINRTQQQAILGGAIYGAKGESPLHKLFRDRLAQKAPWLASILLDIMRSSPAPFLQWVLFQNKWPRMVSRTENSHPAVLLSIYPDFNPKKYFAFYNFYIF
jgi:hypothetical protein